MIVKLTNKENERTFYRVDTAYIEKKKLTIKRDVTQMIFYYNDYKEIIVDNEVIHKEKERSLLTENKTHKHVGDNLDE